MKSFVLLTPLTRMAALCLLSVAAHAQPRPSVNVDDDSARSQLLQQSAQLRDQARQEIELQRAQIQARKNEAEKQCWQRFAVEDCLRAARAQEREELLPLRERDLRINHEERQEKADERLRAIERKQQEKGNPPPLQAQSRPPLTAVPVPSADKAPASPEKTPEDIARQKQLLQTQAQQREAEQAQRVKNHAASNAQRTLSEQERRDRVKRNMQQKQQQAQERQASKADDIAQRKGAPLPIPEGLPQPKP